MTNQHQPHPRRFAAHLALTLALMGVVSTVGCSAAGVHHSSARTAAAASATSDPDLLPESQRLYCRAVAGHAPTWPADGAGDLAAHWAARRTYEHAARSVAPGEIADDWTLIEAWTRNVGTALVETTTGSLTAPPAEPVDVTAARDRVHGYEQATCGVA